MHKRLIEIDNRIKATHQISIVRPGTEFHETRLLVERKVFDVDLAK